MTRLSPSEPPDARRSPAASGSADPPSQAAPFESLVGRISDEFAERVAAGDAPDVEEYARRYPEVAGTLRKLLPTVAVLQDMSADALSDAGGPVDAPRDIDGLLGDFRILREIGRGGMGVVYEAEQVSLKRRVALKVLPFAAVLDPRQLQRFKNEAQAAAGLHCTNIVPVYSVGCERGVHYYAMQYIEGHTLADVIQELRRAEGHKGPGRPAGGEESVASARREAASAGWTPGEPAGRQRSSGNAQRSRSSSAPTEEGPAASESPSAPPSVSGALPPSEPHAPRPVPETAPVAGLSTQNSTRTPQWFRTVAERGIQVAEALEYAHSVGVTHRDIKPGNLILDAQGTLWVMDFGLARIESGTNLTLTGDLVGTLRYMSPEQAQGQRGLVDARTDIYSLAITLYELLTLHPAFTAADRRTLLHQVLTEDPPPPRQINPAIPRDLETIILKAMAKEPAERYASARELADDLRRFLNDRPILARRPSLWERLKRWSRRNVSLLLWATGVSLLALAGLAVASAQILRHEQEAIAALAAARQERRSAERQRQVAEEQSRLAGEQTRLAEEQRRVADIQRRVAEDQRRLAAEREADVRAFLYATEMKLAFRAWESGDVEQVLAHLARYEPASPEAPDTRGFEWHYLWGLCHRDRLTIQAHPEHAYWVAFSPDGRVLSTAGKEGVARLFDVVTGRLLVELRGHTDEVNTAAFSPDGRTIATASEDLTVKLWDAASGREFRTLRGHTDEVHIARFSPDGTLVASAGLDGLVKLWDAATGEHRADLAGHEGTVETLDFSPDGALVASVGMDATIRLWDVAAGTERLMLRSPTGARIFSVAFSPDGRRLASGGLDKHVWLWDLPEGGHSGWLAHAEVIERVAFSPDGQTVVSASKDGTVRLWDAATGRQRARIAGHPGRIWCTAYAPDGRTLATAGADGTVRLWDLPFGETGHALPMMVPRVHSIAFTPDGKSLALATDAWKVEFWNMVKGTRTFVLRPGAMAAKSVTVSPDGTLMAVGSADGGIRFWQLPNREQHSEIRGHWLPVEALAFSPDGTLLASLAYIFDGQRSETVVWNLAERNDRIALPEPGEGVFHRSLAFSPDGRRLAVGDSRGRIGTWDVAAERFDLVGADHEHGHGVLSLAYSGDGRLLASASEDRTAKLWNAETYQLLFTLHGHDGRVHAVAFSADGRTVATGAADGMVKLWHTATGQELATLPALSEVSLLAFCPRGRLLATGLPRRDGHGAELWFAGRPPHGSRPSRW